MKEISDVCACVYDNGLFVPLAIELAKSFRRVMYYSHWEDAFPTINKGVIGDGFEEECVERISNIWNYLDEIDLFVFPDIQHAPLQIHLKSLGKAVWGSGSGDTLELDRKLFHRTLSDVGLEVPTFHTVTGVTALREYLSDKEDKYLKVSRWRGSFETTHWRNWDMDETTLDLLAVRFGPVKESVQFLVFDPIKTDLELGGDTYCVRGNFPGTMIHGIELKNKGYIGAVMKSEDMPKPIQAVNEAFSPVLGQHDYTNFWSTEVRVVKEGESERFYFIDPTCRGGIPSLSSQMALWGNFAEILYKGANGELVEPDPTAKYSIECLITQSTPPTQWGVIKIPEGVDARFGNCCKMDQGICFPPHEGREDDRGWLVSTGNTIAEALEKIKEQAALLPDGVTCDVSKLAEVLGEIELAKDEGIEFATQVPPPEAAISS